MLIICFAGLVSFSVLSMIPATKKKFAVARQSFVAPLRSKGAVSSLVGGALLGMGMTLSGTVSISLSVVLVYSFSYIVSRYGICTTWWRSA